MPTTVGAQRWIVETPFRIAAPRAAPHRYFGGGNVLLAENCELKFELLVLEQDLPGTKL
jgi:hypothetical protein